MRFPELEGAGASWGLWLAEFEEHVFPVFQKRGFTLPQAVEVFTTNLVVNALSEDDESEEWKKE